MRVGQVVGATDKLAGSAIDRPVDFRDVLATVYHNLGIDADAAVTDVSGRRVPILPNGARPIDEVI